MKEFAHELAQKFAPIYIASEEEECYLIELEHQEKPRISKAYPAWNPFVYFSALRLDTQEDLVAYEINYFTIWDWDTGGVLGYLSAHRWDTERTAILVVGPKDEKDPDAFSAKDSYYAAHEGAITDSSDYYLCMSKNCGVTVYWSKGKHASYPDTPKKFVLFEEFNPPGLESKPGEYALLDAGTLDNPKVPWLCNDQPWGPDKVGPVYEKLRIHRWDRKTWERIEIHRLPEKIIRTLQKYLGLSVTGKWDTDTAKAAYRVESQLIRNIQNYSEREFLNIYHSESIRRVINSLANAGFSKGQIEKIVQDSLYQHVMEKNVIKVPSGIDKFADETSRGINMI